jgi:hypothetical protein
MCCCAKPNINGEPGYSWDGKNVHTRPVAPPDLGEGDILLFDEPGRCGGMDSHCHHYRLVRRFGGTELLVRHGGGDERMRVSLPHGFSFEALDTNTRYWTFNALHHASRDGQTRGSDAMNRTYRKAFVEGRLKKRSLPKQGMVKVWIEPSLESAQVAE